MKHKQENESKDELTQLLKEEKARRRQKKEWELKLMGKCIVWLIYAYVAGLIITTINYILLEKEFHYEGIIEDSCQDLKTLKNINDQIFPLLDELTFKKYFKIFRVNLENDCPFGIGEYICTSKKCVICTVSYNNNLIKSYINLNLLYNTCNQSEIPSNWLSPQSWPVNTPKDDFAFWDSERFLCKFQEFYHFKEPSEWIWHVEDVENDKGVYVDLKLNPEAFTGYQGQHIWDVIYRENCYQGSLVEMCKEKRALNKLISGLHTSISTQLSEFYVDLKTNRTYPNYSLYFKRVGNYPDRIKNLFFLYSVLFRAIILATPGIQSYDINSLSFEDDLKSKQLLNQILSLSNSQCSRPFDEQQFFKQITFVIITFIYNFRNKKRIIKDTIIFIQYHIQYLNFDYNYNQYKYIKFIMFLVYIHNISRIMDCVECQKCKVFGKMQTYGLGTALKILFSESPSEFSGRLKRNEFVALINTFGKVSSSINSIDLMYERRSQYHFNLILTIGIIGGVLILFMFIMRIMYREMDKKIQKMFLGMPSEDNRSNVGLKKKRD